MTRLLSGALAVALLAGAVGVTLTLPTGDQLEAPMVVDVALGERGDGRNITAVVDAVTFADEVSTPRWTGETTGVWLVVDARAAGVVSPTSVYARLTIGERTWMASGRPGGDGLQETLIAPGLPFAGAVIFELPADILDEPGAAAAHVEFAAGRRPVLDSAVRVTIDLREVDRVDRLEVPGAARVEW